VPGSGQGRNTAGAHQTRDCARPGRAGGEPEIAKRETPVRGEGVTMVGRNKPAMVEFHTVKRIDNARLVRHVEPLKMRNLYKTAALGAVVALCGILYVYQHFRCIDLSFQL